MKYLLDSHILIWALFADEKLPGEAYAIVNDPKNEIYYSAASVWEVGIKHSKSPEKIPVSSQLLTEGCDMAGMFPLPVTKEHAMAVTRLSRAENTPPHNDPFDKMLIAQAKTEGMIFLTHDHLLKDYGEGCVRTV